MRSNIPTGSILGFLTHDNNLSSIQPIKTDVILICCTVVQWVAYYNWSKNPVMSSLRYNPSQNRNRSLDYFKAFIYILTGEFFVTYNVDFFRYAKFVYRFNVLRQFFLVLITACCMPGLTDPIGTNRKPGFTCTCVALSRVLTRTQI